MCFFFCAPKDFCVEDERSCLKVGSEQDRSYDAAPSLDWTYRDMAEHVHGSDISTTLRRRKPVDEVFCARRQE